MYNTIENTMQYKDASLEATAAKIDATKYD